MDGLNASDRESTPFFLSLNSLSHSHIPFKIFHPSLSCSFARSNFYSSPSLFFPHSLSYHSFQDLSILPHISSCTVHNNPKKNAHKVAKNKDRMSPTSGQANDTPLSGQRPNYGSLAHMNQPAAVRTRAGPNDNASSPAPSLKSRQRQQDGTGTGKGVGAGAGTAGARNTAASHRSVQITVPEQDEHGNAHSNNDQDGDDTSSISSRSSYSTYSSSTGSLQALDHHNHKGHSHGEVDEPGEEEDEASSRRLFWTYVGLTPILLSILVLFAVLLQFLPSSIESGEYIVHWGKSG